MNKDRRFLNAALKPVLAAAVLAAGFPLFAQGGEFNPFGSLDDDPVAASGGVTVGGEISAGFTGYVKDMAEDAGKVQAGDIVKGVLSVSAKGDSVEAFVNLQLSPVFDNQKSPVTLDEAYLTVFFGAFTVDAGLRKLTWGKADSNGPLDVINPLDYSDLSEIKPDDPPKVARPLVHAAFRFGDFSKVEGVFVPWFTGQVFADDGRWEPAQMKEMKQMIATLVQSPGASINVAPPVTTLSYFQAGARFSTTAAHSDVGIQYYTGFLPRPAYSIEMGPAPKISLEYNRYHQIGFDYATTAAGFNIRSETAVNITDDLSGDDPSVYNPHFLWSLGFDRTLFAGINLNIQGNAAIRLFNGGVGKKPNDIEADTPRASTRITAEVSRAFVRDTFRLSTAAIWGIEDKDAYIIPGLTFTRGNAELELSCGFFVGDSDGELGQYHDNNFIKAGIKYVF